VREAQRRVKQHEVKSRLLMGAMKRVAILEMTGQSLMPNFVVGRSSKGVCIPEGIGLFSFLNGEI
jgi:hypothetical protein